MAGVEGMGGEAKGACGAGRAPRHLAADHLSAGNARVRCQAEPGAKTLARLEAGELRPHLGDDGGGDPEVDTGYGGEVDSTNPVQLGAQIEFGLVGILARRLVFLASRDPRRNGRRRLGHDIKLAERSFELAVTRGDLRLEMSVG